MDNLITPSEFLATVGVPYVLKGDDFMIECPWHTGKTKLRINKDTGVHNCFSCKASGNLWSLCIKLTGMNLYDFLGITPEKRKALSFERTLNRIVDVVKEEPEVKVDDIVIKGRSLDIHGSDVPDYVRRSAKSLYLTEDYCDYYGVRYALNQSIRAPHIAPEKATVYSNRFLTPIYSNGKLINVDGRTIVGDNPKVVYCKGGSTSVLFDFERLDPRKLLIVCEGIKDTIKLWHLGYRNITSILGATLTPNHIKQLKLFKDILYLSDNDDAGISTMRKLYDELDIELKIGLPPKGLDPFKCSFDELREMVDNPIDYTDYDLRFISESLKNNANNLWF